MGWAGLGCVGVIVLASQAWGGCKALWADELWNN